MFNITNYGTIMQHLPNLTKYAPTLYPNQFLDLLQEAML